jgi:hypothetical protein
MWLAMDAAFPDERLFFNTQEKLRANTGTDN